MRTGVLALVVAGCAAEHSLQDVPILGASPEVEAILRAELQAFDRQTGGGRVRLSAVQIRDVAPAVGSYTEPAQRIRIDPSVEPEELPQLLRHELCHALDLQDPTVLAGGRWEEMAELSAGLDQLTIVEDLGQRPDEDWTIRETLARLCDLGPWITASTAATRCSDDPDAITDAAAILAEHVWLAPDGPHHREPEGEPVSYDTGRPLVDVHAVGLMDPEHAIKLRWDDELGVGDSEVVDVHTTGIVQVTLDQRVDVRSLHATLDPVGFLPDVLLQSLQELPNGRAVGRAEMTWHHLGKARRNVVRAGEGWDLIGDGCNPRAPSVRSSRRTTRCTPCGARAP